jgi:hypothetical protein
MYTTDNIVHTPKLDNINKLLRIINCAISLKGPHTYKSWPLTPVYYLAYLKRIAEGRVEVMDWKGELYTKHKLEFLYYPGSEKYTEKAKINDEEVDVEVTYNSYMEGTTGIPGETGPIPIDSFKKFIEMLYKVEKLEELPTERFVEEIESKIKIENKYNPEAVREGISEWTIAKYYPTIRLKLDNGEIITIRFSAIWDTSERNKDIFYLAPESKVTIEYKGLIKETSNEITCNYLLQLLSFYTTLKRNISRGTEKVKLKIKGKEMSQDEYIDDMLANALKKIYKDVTTEIDDILNEIKTYEDVHKAYEELNPLAEKCNSLVENYISLQLIAPAATYKEEKEKIERELKDIENEIKDIKNKVEGKLSPQIQLKAQNLNWYYSGVFVPIIMNINTFETFGYKKAHEEYLKIVNKLAKTPKELQDKIVETLEKINSLNEMMINLLKLEQALLQSKQADQYAETKPSQPSSRIFYL